MILNTLHRKRSLQLRISLVNKTKSAVSCGSGHIYWRNTYWKTCFLCSDNSFEGIIDFLWGAWSPNPTNTTCVFHGSFHVVSTWNARGVFVRKKPWKKGYYCLTIANWSLTDFNQLISFYTPWKHQKTSDFLMLSGGIERNQWHEID